MASNQYTWESQPCDPRLGIVTKFLENLEAGQLYIEQSGNRRTFTAHQIMVRGGDAD